MEYSYDLYGCLVLSNIAIPFLRRSIKPHSGARIVEILFERNFPSELNLDFSQSSFERTGKWSKTHDVLASKSDPDQKFILKKFHHKDNPFKAVMALDGSKVWIINELDTPINDLLAVATGPIMGAVLALQEQLCLHASVVLIAGKAVMIGGHSGAGKSTLAMAFGQIGGEILSDDLAVIHQVDECWQVQSGYPRVRLNEDSSLAFGFTPQMLKPVQNESLKYYAPLQSSFAAKPANLGAICILEDEPEQSAGIQRLTPHQTLAKILPHKYAQEYESVDHLKKTFRQLSEIATNVPAYSLCRGQNLTSAKEFARNIQHHIFDDFEQAV